MDMMFSISQVFSLYSLEEKEVLKQIIPNIKDEDYVEITKFGKVVSINKSINLYLQDSSSFNERISKIKFLSLCETYGVALDIVEDIKTLINLRKSKYYLEKKKMLLNNINNYFKEEKEITYQFCKYFFGIREDNSYILLSPKDVFAFCEYILKDKENNNNFHIGRINISKYSKEEIKQKPYLKNYLKVRIQNIKGLKE